MTEAQARAATELKELLEERGAKALGDLAESIGISCVTGEDDVYLLPPDTARRQDVGRTVPLVTGEFIRDWALQPAGDVVFPYDAEFKVRKPEAATDELRYLWPYRAVLEKRKRFGTPILERGLTWYELQELHDAKLRTPLSIVFAFVATHNHFVLDRGGKVFNGTAPIIKLPESATEEDHLALLAYLNSSTACFWMKQAMMNKAGSGIGRGVQDEAWEDRFEFDGTKLGAVPLPPGLEAGTSTDAEGQAAQLRRCLCALGRRIDELARERATHLPAAVIARWKTEGGILNQELGCSGDSHVGLVAEMSGPQEELDWLVYDAFGLLTDQDRAELAEARALATKGASRDPTWTPDVGDTREGILPGMRPFEVALERQVREGKLQTAWFERNQYSMVPNWADHFYPESVLLHLTRIEILARNPKIRVIEKPEYKHRWVHLDYDPVADDVAADAALTAVEQTLKAERAVRTARQMVETALGDGQTREIAELLGDDPARALRELIAGAAVPHLSALRFTESGLDKHSAWQHTWDLQRREDASEEVGEIPVPPKYGQNDYRDPIYWRLRGKLDVPKERFISYPGCESDEDGEPVYGWAGWDHLQRAVALAELYQKRKLEEGWKKERLQPMLAGLLELLPWLKQWHNEPSEELGGDRPGEQFAQFIDAECAEHGFTHDDLRNWRPPEKQRGSGKRGGNAKGKRRTDVEEQA